MENRIYCKTLSLLLDERVITTNDNVLVVCGGSYDYEVLQNLRFERVTISNLDIKYNGHVAPFEWSQQDAEKLTFPDSSFDWVFVHAGLHHCYSPHRAITEMLRVGKKGVLLFESNDNFLIRIGQVFGLVADYEVAAVVGNDCLQGGVKNSTIPNYVYRWTEREIEKVVKSYLPQYKNNSVRYFYNLRIPHRRLEMNKNPGKAYIARMLTYLIKLIVSFFPKQGNEFGILIQKGNQYHDWLCIENEELTISKSYVNKYFYPYK